MAQIIVGDKSPIQDFPFEDEIHDMGDFIVAHPEILGPEVAILARELQVPTIAGLKRLDFLAFDFEFIQLQRFKDAVGKVYAVTDRVEPEVIEPVPTRSQGIYDIKWYTEHSVREQQIQDLQKAIDQLSSVCERNLWNLGVIYVKWSVRFQTPAGRNAFFLRVRKTQNHQLLFCLGQDFDLSKVGISDKIKKVIQHKKGSRWWKIVLAVDEIKDLLPLLEIAYQNITK